MWSYRTPGIPDEFFTTSERVPGPTKEEIRALTVSKARLHHNAYVIDVGCGVGSLSVEAALQVGAKGRVFAIDEDEEAVKLTRVNLAKFGVQNVVQVIHGKAPEAMLGLPMVDAVIVGGSTYLKDVIKVSHEKIKEKGRIVVNAVMLETCYEALQEMKRLNFREIDVTAVFVAKGRWVDDRVMMIARNPITIISATKV
jgi:cobalt-precorrin-6B (C15)-methyltransferase